MKRFLDRILARSPLKTRERHIDDFGMSWTCHICKRERPDERISVMKHPIIDSDSGRQIGHQNVRYCNDRVHCRQAARYYRHFKLSPDDQTGAGQ